MKILSKHRHKVELQTTEQHTSFSLGSNQRLASSPPSRLHPCTQHLSFLRHLVAEWFPLPDNPHLEQSPTFLDIQSPDTSQALSPFYILCPDVLSRPRCLPLSLCWVMHHLFLVVFTGNPEQRKGCHWCFLSPPPKLAQALSSWSKSREGEESRAATKILLGCTTIVISHGQQFLKESFFWALSSSGTPPHVHWGRLR